ncbi:SEC-C metal-binding domain-containing protein [Halobacillus naozhouensis]|uniref:SEC-C metal-binding domain-containing protein n=1 Tax=Halobacillus naozhouensis TaxID=554880 RepID=A0ABY8IXF1_9BACI|nr:SEC-C metal-binding domain-containing protein [Halobacillus naozhouensis]WFT73854.1 SEC-C metal-binding domain-containing protein [Halobacillus naozhouensis]
MEKVGRNDPCPCGSGKKYKKCHGKTNVIEFPSKKVEEELDRYLLQFQDYMYDNYPHLFPSTKASSQEEEIEHFVHLLYKGLFVPQTDGQTVFQHFFKQKKKSMLRPATTKALETWGSSCPSVFRLLEEDSDEFVYVEDALNGGQFKVGRERIPLDNEDLQDFPYYMGILMNWGSFYNFIPLALPNTKSGYDYFISGVEAEFNAQSKAVELSGYLHHTFLDQFPKWLYMEDVESLEDDWDLTLQQNEVIMLLDKHVDVTDQQLEAYLTLKGLWLRFCEEQDPIIRKPAVFAATLEYFFYDVPSLGGGRMVTQKGVAEKYGISPNSISKRHQELEEFFSELIMSYEGFNEGPVFHYYAPGVQIGVERSTYELNKKVEQMNFDSIDDINMNHHRNDPFVPANDTELAQIKAYEAYETEDKEEKRRLVNEALSLDENNIDGLALRAEFTNVMAEKLIFVLEAVDTGYRRLGEWDDGEDAILWQVIEARPFLRAIEFLAELYEEKGEQNNAIDSYEDLIELNPNDNQGIRSQLIPLYIERERYFDLQKLLDLFPNEMSTERMFTIALLKILLGMDRNDSTFELKSANSRNEFVYELLSGEERMPAELPAQFSPGTFEEAVVYVHRNGHLWKSHLHHFEPIL